MSCKHSGGEGGKRLGGVVIVPMVPKSLILFALLLSASTAGAQELTPQERSLVDARLQKIEPFSKKLSIAAGDTLFIDYTKTVPANRIRKSENDYEALVTTIKAPGKVVVHPRADELSFERQGSNIVIRFRYAVHVEPGAVGGGPLRISILIVERTGLANTLLRQKLNQRVTITATDPSTKDLGADFLGYRSYKRRFGALRAKLAQSGLRMSPQDNARLPDLSRVNGKAAALAFATDRARRRMWIAQRHLVEGSRNPDQKKSALAKQYLTLLDEKDASKLPNVRLIDAPQASAPPPTPALEVPTGDGPLEPVATYDPNSDAEQPTPTPPRPPPPKVEDPPAPPPPGTSATAVDPTADTTVVSSDPLAARSLRKETPIPGYSRGLVLDDVNIAHGGSVSMTWARVRLQDPADTLVYFIRGQAAFTRFLGVEASVPLGYVNIDGGDEDQRLRSVVAPGNPLVAVKFRAHLPKIEGRQPAITTRLRWGIPVVPSTRIPPTPIAAEEYTREAHFADPSAFFLEKHDLGLGVNGAWQWRFLQLGAQFGFDYFFPTGGAPSRSSFPTINYGLSVGAMPIGDIIGGFVEARAVSLLAGPRRTEFFTYFGARSRIADLFEPAIWVGVPLGSVRRSNPVQLGVELRLSYDVTDVVESGKRSRDEELIQ